MNMTFSILSVGAPILVGARGSCPICPMVNPTLWKGLMWTECELNTDTLSCLGRYAEQRDKNDRVIENDRVKKNWTIE